MRDLKQEMDEQAREEVERLGRMAKRAEETGQPVMARLLRNAIFLLEPSPDWEDYAWLARKDGRTDDVEVKRP
jgi:hypothetical protein